MSNHDIQQTSIGYILSIILIIIGGIGSIVGLCASVEWLIGVGIALVCISSVLAYNSISSGMPDSL